MPFAARYPFAAGTAGLSLRAALVDDANAIHATHRDITTGFLDVGAGLYRWTYASHPDGFGGLVVFYTGTLGGGATTFAGVTVKAIAEVGETERVEANVLAGIAALPAAVWAVFASTLTGVGTIGKFLLDRLNLIGSGTAFASTSVLYGGKITLYKGLDRVAAAGNPLTIRDPDGTNLPDVGTAMRLQAVHTGDESQYFEVTGAVASGGGDVKDATFDLPRTAHSALRTGQFRYLLYERAGGTWNKLEAVGTLDLKPGLAAAA